MELVFYGATGTVTGSRYLVRDGGRAVLLDCGLFQGVKALRLRNWAPLPVDPTRLHAVVLTHAHLDHSGWLPRLVREGFRGRIYCSAATRDLCEILLRDAAKLQEEDAAYANRKGYSKHKPALPLYTERDAEAALRRFDTVVFGQDVQLAPQLSFRLLPAGHLLGAAIVLLRGREVSIAFSGDLGRYTDPLMKPPSSVDDADYVVVESTYADRSHPDGDPEAELEGHLRRVLERRGVAVIPAFAVGRTQVLLHFLARLKARGVLAGVPVYLNSPMARDATRIYHEHRPEHLLTPEECRSACEAATIVNSVQESKALNRRSGPLVILSASGMATGGRVLHHLKAYAPDARNMILFGGYQAAGTRGATMLAGTGAVKIHGEYVPVRAEVVQLRGLSTHADGDELLRWLGGLQRAPRRLFITHGEPAAADALRRRVTESLGWPCVIPEYLQRAEVT
jgi:metallo-beta-lactamase family protein